MNKIKDGNYINIQAFMIKDLNLKGNELIIYAIIFGFSQAENQTFSGSLQYLADWTNSTKQGVMNCLKSLQAKGHIVKEENYINGVKFVSYYATKFNTLLNKVEQGACNKVEQGMQQSLPNNIDNNIKDNNINNNKRFVPPTLEEVKQYCQERKNNVDPERFIDYYTSNGWIVGKNKMKDWKAAVRNWERSNYSSSGKTGANGIKIDDRQTDALDGIL